MSELEHIVDRVRSGERVIEDWIMLKNCYFRGERGYRDMLAWAEENGIKAARRDIKSESFAHIEFDTVEFYSDRS